MREFKFRVWNKITERMMNQEDLEKTVKTLCKNDFVTGMIIPQNKDAVVMQYTGLKDKNGKEIYEGDIVEFSSMFHHNTAYVGTIKYYKGEFQIEWLDEEINIRWDIRFWVEERTAEIIGNIYENKELLEN